MATTDSARPDVDSAGARWVRRAWISLALLPGGFVLGSLVGAGILAMQGYDASVDDPPLSALLPAAIPALIVLMAPGFGAVWCGLEARRLGQRRARLVILLGLAVALGSLLLNVAAYVAG